MEKIMKKNLLISIILSLSFNLSFAQIQWQDNGIPVRQGDNIDWNQTSVACNDETFVTVWTDTRDGIRGIYAQKVDENGSSLWGETGLEIYNTNTMQDNPIAISSTNNTIIVCWQDYDAIEVYSSKIRVQKIDASGNLLWGNAGILLDESGINDLDTKIMNHNDGGVYVIWQETYQSEVRGIRLLADGSIAEGWGEGLELLPTTYRYDAHTDQMNGIILASKTDDDIYIQRIGEDGNKLWGYYGTLLHNGNEDIREIDICSSVANEYYFAWRTYGQNGVREIAIQKADSTGNPIWDSPTIIMDEYATKLNAICSSDSQPIITWTQDFSLYSQKLDSNGNLLWGDDGIILFESDYYLYSNSFVVKEDDTNCCIISWAAEGNDFENNIYIQRVNSNGDLLFGEDGLTIYESSDYYLTPSLAIADQKYHLCWLDNTSNSQSLIHQIVDGDGDIYLEENGEEVYTGLSGSVIDYQMVQYADNLIIIWSERNNNYNCRFHLQILNEDGSTVFVENGIPITADTNSYLYDFETVYGENSENIALVWAENRLGYQQIFAQGIDTWGNLLWADSTGICLTPLVSEATKPKISLINNSGTDEYYIGWEDFTDFFDSRITGQKIVDGNLEWGTEGKFIVDREYNDELTDVVENYYIWQSVSYNNRNIFCLKVDENGDPAPGWPVDGLEVCFEDGVQRDARGLKVPDGLLIIWEDMRNGYLEIYGQIVTPNGEILWQDGGIPLIEGEYIDNFNTHYDNALYIVWNEQRESSYPSYYMQKFNENGETLWQDGGIRISYWTYDSQSEPVLVSVEQDILVVWQHIFIDYSTHINAQLVSPDGEMQYGLEGITICDPIMVQNFPQVYVNGSDAYICWRDGRSTIMGEEGLVSIPGIYTQKIHLEPTSVEENLIEPNFILSNYPNPFNPETTISFSLITESTENTEINIFNIKGQRIRTIDCHTETVEVSNNSNSYSVTWNGTDTNNQPVASGIYFYQLNVDDKVIVSRKCLLLK
jgi:hypothetical protein